MLILGTTLKQTEWQAFAPTLALPAISVGVPEIIIILVVVILVFGTKRLPELGKGLGKSIKEFKSEMNQENSQGNSDHSSEQQPLAQTGTPDSPDSTDKAKSAKMPQEHNV